LKEYEYDDYRILVTIGITILILIPLSIPRNITSLRYLSTICIVAVLYIVIVAMIETIVEISNGDDKFSKLEWIKFNRDLPNAVTIIFFSFNAITTVPMVYSELQNRSYKKMSKIINRSIFMSGILYLLLGTFGYLSDPVNTPKLITDNTNPKEIDIPMIIAKFLICFALVGSMSLAHFPLRLTTE